MRLIKQSTSIPIMNMDDLSSKKKIHENRHSSLLPNFGRYIVVGSSNSGRTNAVLSLLLSENGLKYSSIYIYSPTIEQDKYEFLKKVLQPLKEVNIFMFKSTDEIIKPEEVLPNSIIIFDDVVATESQINIKNYFCMARHVKADVFFISQSYTKIDKQLIRSNANFLIVFRQDLRSLKHIFDDFSIASDMDFKLFSNFCYGSWKEKYGFICISTENSIDQGKYRRNFDNFLKI